MKAFEFYLRTGRRLTPIEPVQLKFNPWHDADDGRFTFEGRGRYFAGGGGSGGGAGATSRAEWGPKKAPAKPKSRTVFRPGGGSFGGGGATATGIWPAPGIKMPLSGRQNANVGVRTKLVVDPRPSKPKAVRVRHTVNGYHFDVDDTRRTRFVDAALRLAPAKRSRTAQRAAGRPDRQRTDDGGHYIAARFNGPHNEFNHFAQDANFNRGSYRALEDEWAAAVRRKQRVRVTITPIYEGSSRRPSELRLLYTVDGVARSRRFKNKPGGR